MKFSQSIFLVFESALGDQQEVNYWSRLSMTNKFFRIGRIHNKKLLRSIALPQLQYGCWF
jgi:hypothetical protein